jgi:hypothetical protein
MYLQQQQLSAWDKAALTSYFFTQKEELAATEEEELAKPTPFDTVEICLLCEHIAITRRELLHPKSILEMF